MRVKPTDPVYPVASEVPLDYNGMSHRTYIAAQIMAGMAAQSIDDIDEMMPNGGYQRLGVPLQTVVASLAVQWTDALITELNKMKGE